MKRRKVMEQTPSGLANPFIDSQIKQVFDKRTSLKFLNSILKPDKLIVDVEFENNESNDTSLYGQRIYFDVTCTDADGRKFIVEMQNYWEKFLRNRIVYYACRKIDEMGREYDEEVRDYTRKKILKVQDLKPDVPKYDLKPVCIICLLNDTDKDIPEQVFRQDAMLYDMANDRIFSDKLRVIMINLRLLEPENMGMDVEFYENILNLMRQIAENMTTKEDLIAEIDATPYDEESKAIFRWVVNVSDLNRMGEEERALYEERRKFYLDQMAVLYAEHEEGREEGIAIGDAQGGHKAMIKVALKMKTRGDSISDIIDLTGLSEAEVEAL